MNGLYFMKEKLRFFAKIGMFQCNLTQVNAIQIMRNFISECFNIIRKKMRGHASKKIKIEKNKGHPNIYIYNVKQECPTFWLTGAAFEEKTTASDRI